MTETDDTEQNTETITLTVPLDAVTQEAYSQLTEAGYDVEGAVLDTVHSQIDATILDLFTYAKHEAQRDGSEVTEEMRHDE